MIEPIAMRSFVRARALLTAFLALSAFGAHVRVAHADGIAAPTATVLNAASDEERFRKLKSEGDRALAEKRLHDAIKAYNAALDFRNDPLIAGRFGLAISFFDDPRAPADAAGFLYEAVRDVAGASSQEKDAFFAAYKRVRKLVCKLSIDTNEANARIDVGDGVKPHHTSFFVFVKKGQGEAVASLEGRADIRKAWDCAGNHDIELRFDFPPVVADPAKPITVTEPSKETVKFLREPIALENSVAKPETNARNRVKVSFGPVAVFRAAPSTAFGVNVAVNYAFENWSAMIAARGAWSTSTLGSASIDSFVFAAMGGPCVRWKWFDGCVAITIASLRHGIGANQLYKPGNGSLIIPGLGLGMGVRRQLSPTFALRLAGDFALLTESLSFTRQGQDQVDRTWNGGNILFGLSLMGIFAR